MNLKKQEQTTSKNNVLELKHKTIDDEYTSV